VSLVVILQLQAFSIAIFRILWRVARFLSAELLVLFVWRRKRHRSVLMSSSEWKLHSRYIKWATNQIFLFSQLW